MSTEDLIRNFARIVRSGAPMPVVHKAFTQDNAFAQEEVRTVVREDITHVRKTRKEIYADIKHTIQDRKKVARKQLADELREARKKLSKLRKQEMTVRQDLELKINEEYRTLRKSYAERCGALREIAKKRRERYSNFVFRGIPEAGVYCGAAAYPDIPPPEHIPTEFGDGIPDVPGIYFFWDGDTIVYVGQSVCLKQRLQLPGHHVLKAHYLISVLPVERHYLTWTECYYIGLTQAKENYGRSASHYLYAKNRVLGNL